MTLLKSKTLPFKNYMNDSFWQKSYLLEFQKNNVILDAYTFSVAPENEEFSFPQRINETKTFGGSVIDDYGNDIAKITFSGSTINQEVKRIFRGELSQEFLNGEQEIFYLKELFQKYGRQDNLENKTVYLYALDSGNKAKWWKVYPLSFDIKRSKDSPLKFNYVFSMMADPEVSVTQNWQPRTMTYTSGLPRKAAMIAQPTTISELRKNVDALIDTIKKNVDYLNSFRNYIRGWATAFSDVNQCITDVRKAVELYEKVAMGYVNDVASVVEEITSLGKNIIKTKIRLTIGVGANLYSTALALLESITVIKDVVYTTDYTNLLNGYLSQYNETTEKIQDIFTLASKENEDCANKIYQDTLAMITDKEFLVVPGTDGNDDEIVKVYGFMTKKAKADDTWDALSAQVYGSAEYGNLIAAYNSNNKIESGKEIKIPVLSQTENTNTGNEIYTVPEKRSNYGSDIKINKYGDFETLNGDLGGTVGVETVTQAINNRLKTAANSRIRELTYGIKANIGTSEKACNIFIISSIEQTVLADPRVKSIESIEYTGEGDNLNVAIQYKDINGDHQTYGGKI